MYLTDKFSFKIKILLLCCLLLVSLSLNAKPSWSVWVSELRQQAIADGVDPEVFDKVFKRLQPNNRIIQLDRRQPERRLTFIEYRNTRADAYRIRLGKREYNRYRPLLNEVSRRYGVSACFIVSIWGLETSYGRFMGSFPVIQSLATLAYDDRRSEFFRRQLLYALHILSEGHIDIDDFKGEWAGASGHPQFLPSSWYQYAIDYNGDGRKDIWKTHSDAFASIANYLVQNGWKTGQPWAIQVTVPYGFDENLMSIEYKQSVADWLKAGVRIKLGQWRPNPTLMASIIHPDGGPTFMTFNNFDVIMKWNRSIYYAGTVGYMAEKICGR